MLLMEKYKDSIFDFLRQTFAIMQNIGCHNISSEQEEETLIETFCANLHCSKAMYDSMKQYIRYLALAKVDYVSLIRELYEKKLLPCKDKREGKRRFEEFKRRLF